MTWANAAGVRNPSRWFRQNAGSVAPPVFHRAIARATCSAASERSPPWTFGRSDTAVVANRSHHSACDRIPDAELLLQLAVGPGRGRGQPLGVQVELPADGQDQVLGPRVADGVVAAGEDREQPLVAEDVPRVDQRAAVDPPPQQVLDLGEQTGHVRRACPSLTAKPASVCRSRISAPKRVAGAGMLAARVRAAAG